MMAAKQTYQGEGVLLKDLLKGIADVDVSTLGEVLVLGLSADSRRLGPGDLFLACGGTVTKGHSYIDDAIKYGACAVLFESTVEDYVAQAQPSVPVLGVENLSEKLGLLADRFYGSPSKELVVTGVTGTNGKTSCSHIIAHALSKAMSTPAGVMGTLGYGLCGNLSEASHTTPDSITMHRLLRDMKKQGAKDVVMEVSSHGLDQGRIVGVEVDVAVFTNISRDHLDYHKTMQAYVDTKKRLFGLPSLKCAVVNLDDVYANEIVDAVSPFRKVVGYTLNADVLTESKISARVESVIHGSIVNTSMLGSEVFVECAWGRDSFTTSLLGEFNVSNLLAALGVLLWRGVGFAEALARLSTVRPLSGRMEVVARHDASPIVVIDYAHTPDALEKALCAIKRLSNQRLWCVFGCGGNRDSGKRALMGRVAEQYADLVIVTDDNPRTESPHSIVNDILSGMSKPEDVHVIHNREKAIQYALQNAQGDEVVLIAGKGHEDYQEVNGERHFFSDHAVVLAYSVSESSL